MKIDTVASVVLMIVAVGMGGAVVHREFASPATASRGTPAPPQHIQAWADVVHSGILVGNPRATVTIAEFGDFECPYCRRFATALQSVRKQYGDRIAFVFVQYPLSGIHRFALPAARAAECAAAQNDFDSFQSLLYEKQDSLGLKPWSSFAKDAGVSDLDEFSRCNGRTDAIPRVEAGRAIARRLGISATPTVLINGWRLSIPPSDTSLARIGPLA